MDLVAAAALLVLCAAAPKDPKAPKEKVEDALAKSCEVAKKNVLERKEQCAAAASQLESLDCSDEGQRKSVDYLKLNAECAKAPKPKKK